MTSKLSLNSLVATSKLSLNLLVATSKLGLNLLVATSKLSLNLLVTEHQRGSVKNPAHTGLALTGSTCALYINLVPETKLPSGNSS